MQGMVICWIMAVGLRVLGDLGDDGGGGVGDWSGDNPSGTGETCNGDESDNGNTGWGCVGRQ